MFRSMRSLIETLHLRYLHLRFFRDVHIDVDTRRHYFSTLNETQVLAMHEKYKMDFKLFGYNIEPYLQYTS